MMSRRHPVPSIDSCSNKTPFKTEALAMETGRRFKQRAYECRYCKQWHLTNIKNNRRYAVDDARWKRRRDRKATK